MNLARKLFSDDAKLPIAFVSSVLGSTLSGGVCSVTFSGHQVGDLLIACLGTQDDDEGTYTSGWTKATWFYTSSTSQRSGMVLYKFATSTANDTVTLTNAGTSTANYAGGMTFRNVSGIGTIEIISGITGDADKTIPIPAITPSVTDGSSWLYACGYIPLLTGCTDYTLASGQLYIANIAGTQVARTASSSSNLSNISAVLELLN